MKKFLLVLLFLVVSITGCSVRMDNSVTKIADDKANEIIECFNNRDTDGIKELFCDDVRNTVEIDKQIDSFFNDYHGNISNSKVELGHSSEVLNEGKITEKYVSAYIYIETYNDEKYTIYFAYYHILEKKPSMEGIYRISITDESSKEFLIGKHITVSDLK